MAEIYVRSSAALEQIIIELTQEHANMIDYQLCVDQEQAKLAQMWTGDASTEFQAHYNKEKGNFDKMIEALQQYIDALQEIKERYETTEEANKNIASN